MNNNYLLIDNKPWTYVRFGIGILVIIAGITGFISKIGDLRIIDYLILFVFILAGITNMTNDFGASRTWFKVTENGLMIKVPSRLKASSFEDPEIDKIIFQRSQIMIDLKSKKQFHIKLKPYNIYQKRQIYNFMTDYSNHRQITIEKHLQ